MSNENIRMHCYKKSNCIFLQLLWRKLLKIAPVAIFPTSMMVLFEFIKGSKVTCWTNCAFPWSYLEKRQAKQNVIVQVFSLVYQTSMLHYFLAFITFTPIFDDKTDTKILTSLFKNIGPKNLDIWTFFHAMKTAENIKNKCLHLLDQS